MDDCSAEYAKIKIVLLRWARVSVPIWAGYVGQCGGQGAHLDKIWQMYWQPVHHRGRGTAIQHRFTCVCVCVAWSIQCNIIQGIFKNNIEWLVKSFSTKFLRILLKQDTALLSNVSQCVSHRRDISSFLDNLIV